MLFGLSFKDAPKRLDTLQFLTFFILKISVIIIFQADQVLPQEQNTDWIWEWSSRIEVQPQK